MLSCVKESTSLWKRKSTKTAFGPVLVKHLNSTHVTKTKIEFKFNASGKERTSTQKSALPPRPGSSSEAYRGSREQGSEGAGDSQRRRPNPLRERTASTGGCEWEKEGLRQQCSQRVMGGLRQGVQGTLAKGVSGARRQAEGATPATSRKSAVRSRDSRQRKESV